MPASRKNARKKKALHTGADSISHLWGLVNRKMAGGLDKNGGGRYNKKCGTQTVATTSILYIASP